MTYAPEMAVGTVIVTYQRPETLFATLTAVLGQSHPPDVVVVVDNDADHRVERTVALMGSNVVYQRSASNVGYGAGLAHGMRFLRSTLDPDWYWLLDDDSPPSAGYLGAVLETAAESPYSPWVVANRGGRIIRGHIRHGFDYPGEVNLAQFTLVDGTLVSRKAVEVVGFPREDLFMMFEDVEYTTRISSAGGVLLVRPADVNAMHLGSGAAWRSFYQARNHLRIALDRRSPAWLWGWAYRMMAFSLTDVRRRRWRSLRFRWWGALDGLRNRMGSKVHGRLLGVDDRV